MTLRITWEEASARRLERQFLAVPAKAGTPVAEVVAAMLGAHAQVLSAAEVSVGVRAGGVTRTDVRAALWEDRSLVKTYGPRGTLHLLPSAELPLWTAALTAVPSGPSPFPPDVRLTEAQADDVVTAICDALDGAYLTIDELSDEVVASTGPWAGDLVMPAFQVMWPRWRQVMHRAGQRGALCFGPNRGRKVTYTRPPRFEPLGADEGLSLLVRRYLRAYGPATAGHFAKWAAAPLGWALELFASLAGAGEIEEVDFEGPAWVAAGDTEFPGSPVRGVRLLSYFDAYVIAAQPREVLFPGAAYGRALAGGQAGNYPVLLVDGVVAGVWHQRRHGRRTTVTVEPLGRLTAAHTPTRAAPQWPGPRTTRSPSRRRMRPRLRRRGLRRCGWPWTDRLRGWVGPRANYRVRPGRPGVVSQCQSHDHRNLRTNINVSARCYVPNMTTNPGAKRVPYTGGEKESLHASLDRHRDAVLWKLEGLDDEQVRRVMTSSGTNLLGLVKHLASVEYGWFCSTFGREVEPLWFDPSSEEDMSAGQGETTAGIVAFYGRARAAADRTISELSLDELGKARNGTAVSLRWVLIRMVEETARHAGHMDILRELIDGSAGDHRPG